MQIKSSVIRFDTKGFTDIIDITESVAEHLRESGLVEGIATISAVGSTTGITTLEYEPGLVNHDVADLLEQLAPYGKAYEHNKTWNDDNGSAHLRSALVGTSQTIPFIDGNLVLGTWQQVVFIDFDTRARQRHVVVQFLGE